MGRANGGKRRGPGRKVEQDSAHPCARLPRAPLSLSTPRTCTSPPGGAPPGSGPVPGPHPPVGGTARRSRAAARAPARAGGIDAAVARTRLAWVVVGGAARWGASMYGRGRKGGMGTLLDLGGGGQVQEECVRGSCRAGKRQVCRRASARPRLRPALFGAAAPHSFSLPFPVHPTPHTPPAMATRQVAPKLNSFKWVKPEVRKWRDKKKEGDEGRTPPPPPLSLCAIAPALARPVCLWGGARPPPFPAAPGPRVAWPGDVLAARAGSARVRSARARAARQSLLPRRPPPQFFSGRVVLGRGAAAPGGGTPGPPERPTRGREGVVMRPTGRLRAFVGPPHAPRGRTRTREKKGASAAREESGTPPHPPTPPSCTPGPARSHHPPPSPPLSSHTPGLPPPRRPGRRHRLHPLLHLVQLHDQSGRAGEQGAPGGRRVGRPGGDPPGPGLPEEHVPGHRQRGQALMENKKGCCFAEGGGGACPFPTTRGVCAWGPRLMSFFLEQRERVCVCGGG